MSNLNKAVAGAKEYYPLNEPKIGVALPKVYSPLISHSPCKSGGSEVVRGPIDAIPAECTASAVVPTVQVQRRGVQEPHLRGTVQYVGALSI